jgi:hypothetical protein
LSIFLPKYRHTELTSSWQGKKKLKIVRNQIKHAFSSSTRNHIPEIRTIYTEKQEGRRERLLTTTIRQENILYTILIRYDYTYRLNELMLANGMKIGPFLSDFNRLSNTVFSVVRQYFSAIKLILWYYKFLPYTAQ